MLHGGMGNALNWSNQIEALVGAGHLVVLMDTRGHGRSTHGNQVFSYRRFALDVGLLIQHLALPEVILVGWSDGACTALEFARAAPAQVKGVVFFACNVDPSGTLEFRMTDAIQNCLTRHKRDFENLTPALNRFEDLQPALEPMQKNEPNYSPRELAEIDVPVVVVQGERDEFIKLEHAKYIASSLGHGRLQVLEGLGHFAPIQDPDRFNRVILEALCLFKAGGSAFDSH
jgi:non-heme chloroperoxidase